MLRETCLLLSNKNNKKDYNDFLTYVLEAMKAKIELFKKDDNYINFFLSFNYLLFILMVTINLKDYIIFIKLLFKKYFKMILNLIKEIKNEKTRKILLDLLSGLFLEEYKSIYFRKDEDKELEELYINKEVEITKLYLDTINSYTKEVYNKIFYILLDFNLNYDNNFNNYSNKISYVEKPIFKINLI